MLQPGNTLAYKPRTFLSTKWQKTPFSEMDTTTFSYIGAAIKITALVSYNISNWDQVNSWKNLWKFWNGSLCRNKSGPFPVLNVAAYCKSSITEACVKTLSQILANNIDNGGRGIRLRIYVRYCLKQLMKNVGALEKPGIFFSLNSLFLMFGIC